jgi:RNA polymerase sigma-70 factor (ECF subfamily)
MDDGTSQVGRLLHDARKGRSDALAQLLGGFRHYLNLLARTGLPADLRRKIDAADMVQETLLKAHQRFGQFRGGSEKELAGWLRQILARTLADLTRRYRAAEGRQVDREKSLHEVLEASSAALGSLLAARGHSPSQSAERREMSVVLADALAELPDDYREVLVLRSIEERDWDEVARVLQRSQGAVRMLWTRALKQLRPLIEARI